MMPANGVAAVVTQTIIEKLTRLCEGQQGPRKAS